MKRFGIFLTAISLLAPAAQAQNVKLIDPATGIAYRVGDREVPWAYAGATGGITTTADTPVIAAAGGVQRNYLTGLQFKNTSATASEIVVKDGSTIIWRGHVGASMTFMETITFPIPLRSSQNAALNVALLTTATATIVSAQGYTAK